MSSSQDTVPTQTSEKYMEGFYTSGDALCYLYRNIALFSIPHTILPHDEDNELTVPTC